jgi:FkbM family methyltransferase
MSFAAAAAAMLRRALIRPATRESERRAALEPARALLGAQPLVAVDIGAANGLLPHWESLDGLAEIVQVEPRQDACAELERQNALRADPTRYRVVQSGLSEFGGECTLYVSNAPTGSSLLRLDPATSPDCRDYVDLTYLYPIIEERIGTSTLSEVMNGLGLAQLDLVKLDVQGSEVAIVRGLDPVRRSRLLAAELELGLHDLYPREASFEVAREYMEAMGMELFDVRVARVHRPYGNDHAHYQRRVFGVHANSPTISARIWEFDAVFFRRKSLLVEDGDPLAMRRMMLAYCTYNFYSEAYSLAEKALAAGVLGRPDADAICKAIVELHRRRLRREWLADSPALEGVRRLMYRIAPRSAPRWCQYMYQEYPNG